MYTIPQSRRFFNISKMTIPQVISGYPLIGIRRYIRFNLISIGQAVCAVEQMLHSSTHRSRVIEPIRAPEDIDRIRESLSEKSRDLLFFDLATQTGIRTKELLKLKAKDLFGLKAGDLDGQRKPSIKYHQGMLDGMLKKDPNEVVKWLKLGLNRLFTRILKGLKY